jgi:TRAP transporter TAXI family solute receptor
MAEPIPTRREVLLAAGGAAAQGGAAVGQSPMPRRADRDDVLTARANNGTVGVISGGVEGTYIRIAADLASVLDDREGLRVLPVIGKGSVQNLADIIYLRGIDMGIVQSDALAFVRQENMFPTTIGAINYIAKLYDEEIHVLARREIAQLSDLAGKAVNVDVRGSGTAITASLVFAKLGVPIEAKYEPQSNALNRLRNNEIAALVYVAGKPASLFKGLIRDSGLHFLPLPATAALIDTYLPAELGPDVYPDLMTTSEPVETLAVGAVMAVFGWQPGSERHRRVARFVAALSENFEQFQKPPRHPKWREVNLRAEVPGWRRFAVAPGANTAPGLPGRWRQGR